MARIGLGARWRCLFANEWCEKKSKAYRLNHGPSPELLVEDVAKLTTSNLRGNPVLSWASFPCQDLSLAGLGRGLNGKRSGTFWPFWHLMKTLDEEGRGIPVIVLENVVGALTSNRGLDFLVLFDTLTSSGYRVGPMVIDAVHFVPQSRQRLFIVAVKSYWRISSVLTRSTPLDLWHPKPIRKAYETLPHGLRKFWIWWNMPSPPPGRLALASVIEKNPEGVRWHTSAETQRLLSLMSDANLRKVNKVQKFNEPVIGAVYKRTRRNEQGRVQRAEVRFDQVSGCLRTPVGGSSRQILLFVNGKEIRSRLLSPREGARLMGLPDDFKLPRNYNEAYHLVGDGLVVPVVSWLEQHLLYHLATRSLLLKAA